MVGEQLNLLSGSTLFTFSSGSLGGDTLCGRGVWVIFLRWASLLLTYSGKIIGLQII